MYHKIIIAGYLGRDPEMRYTPTGQAVTHFSVAASRRWTDREGNQQEETVWFRVSAWGKQAEICNQYLTKGRPVLVEGRLRPDPETGGPRVWTGNDGKPRASFEINALNVRFLAGRGEAAAEAPEVEGEPPPDLEENELPF